MTQQQKASARHHAVAASLIIPIFLVAIVFFQLSLMAKMTLMTLPLPNYVSAHYNIANVLARLGKRDEAVQHYQAILRLQPNFAPAQQALKRIQKSP